MKVDIPDEKFAITAFIVGLGVQSKDLMISISKNPQASMAEVLAKAEKYIKGEEALVSKKESSSTHKEKSRTDKQQGRSPKRQRNRERSPKKDRERCDAPIPSPTRLANPNRFRGAKPYTGTPYYYYYYYFYNQQSFIFTIELPPEWYPLKFIHIY